MVSNSQAKPRADHHRAVEIETSRVNDKRIDLDTGERYRFRSVIVPRGAARALKVSEVLPLLYLHGLSTRNFRPALTEFLGRRRLCRRRS